MDTLAPNADGVFTTFDFNKDPDTISDEFMPLKRRRVHTLHRPSLFKDSLKSVGVEIKYVNDGVPNSVQEWNKFLEGFPDPDQLPDDDVTVEEPRVGGEKSIIRLDFLRNQSIQPVVMMWMRVMKFGLLETLVGHLHFMKLFHHVMILI